MKLAQRSLQQGLQNMKRQLQMQLSQYVLMMLS